MEVQYTVHIHKEIGLTLAAAVAPLRMPDHPL